MVIHSKKIHHLSMIIHQILVLFHWYLLFLLQNSTHILQVFSLHEHQTRPGGEPHQNSINSHQNSMFIFRNLMHILHLFFFDEHQTRLGDEPSVVMLISRPCFVLLYLMNMHYVIVHIHRIFLYLVKNILIFLKGGRLFDE